MPLMKNEPLDEKDFPEALDAFMAVHAELIHAVVLQSFGEGPEFLAQGGVRAGFFWDSADPFPDVHDWPRARRPGILWIKWEVMGETWTQPVRDFDKGEVFTDDQLCRKKPSE